MQFDSAGSFNDWIIRHRKQYNCTVDQPCRGYNAMYIYCACISVFQTLIDSVWLVVSHHYYPFTMYRKIDGNESHCFIWLCYYTPYWSDGGTEWIFLKKKKPYSFRKVSLDSKNFNFWWRIWNLHNSLFFIVKANFYINCSNLWHFNGQKFVNWTLCDHTSHSHRHIYYAKTSSITIRKKWTKFNLEFPIFIHWLKKSTVRLKSNARGFNYKRNGSIRKYVIEKY